MARRPPDLSALAGEAARLLSHRRETLAVAESSAGGLINAALVAVPGASAFYLGGAIIYTGASRSGFLDIGEKEMTGIRSATQPMAQLLARRVREKVRATWGLAETGAAGPTGNRYGDPAGHACIAVSGPVEKVVTLETGRAAREENMRAFTLRALELLESCLREALA